jgi:hypothetical protein
LTDDEREAMDSFMRDMLAEIKKMASVLLSKVINAMETLDRKGFAAWVAKEHKAERQILWKIYEGTLIRKDLQRLYCGDSIEDSMLSL